MRFGYALDTPGCHAHDHLSRIIGGRARSRKVQMADDRKVLRWRVMFAAVVSAVLVASLGSPAAAAPPSSNYGKIHPDEAPSVCMETDLAYHTLLRRGNCASIPPFYPDTFWMEHYGLGSDGLNY